MTDNRERTRLSAVLRSWLWIAVVCLTIVGVMSLLGSEVVTSLAAGPPATGPRPAVVSTRSVLRPARDLVELQQRIREIADERVSAGVSVAVIEDGHTVWTAGFGHADIMARRRATGDTVYRVGSFSKTVLALTMAILEFEGRLDLSVPLSETVSDVEFENRFAREHPIIVAHLLEHSSGFDEMRFNEIFAESNQLDWSTKRVLSLNPRSREVRWPPGTRHSYSQTGYTMAGHVVEAVTGASFEAVVRDRIFEPLGLGVASYRPTGVIESMLAVPYERDLRPMEPMYLHHRPGTHLYVSAREFGRFVELLAARGVLDGRRVVPEALLERIEHGGTLPYRGLSPAYGLGVHYGQERGVTMFMHRGWLPGYRSEYRYVPEVRSGYVMLTNEPRDEDAVWEISAELSAYVRRHATPERPRPVVDLDPTRLESFRGWYEAGFREVEFTRAFDLTLPVRVEVSGRGLLLHHPGEEPWQVVPTDGQRFRGLRQTQASVLFSEAADGTPIVWDGNRRAYYESVSGAWVVVRRTLAISVITVLSLALLWPVLWLPRALLRWRPPAGLYMWPCLGSTCAFLFVWLIYDTPVRDLGAINVSTVAVFVLSCMLPVCTVASVIACSRRSVASVYSRAAGYVVTTGLVLTMIHFARFGIIGLRTWTW